MPFGIELRLLTFHQFALGYHDRESGEESVIVRDVLWYHASNVLFHKVLMPSVNLLG